MMLDHAVMCDVLWVSISVNSHNYQRPPRIQNAQLLPAHSAFRTQLRMRNADARLVQ